MTDNRTGTLAEREIAHLMTLHPKGFDLSLDRITRLLERLGNPHLNLPPVIHIAGTNGKGSCAAFARARKREERSREHARLRRRSAGTVAAAPGRAASVRRYGRVARYRPERRLR